MGDVTVTRVINACVLLELAGGAVLTDPYFESHWFMRFDEPIGLSVEQLPKLAAVVGGHGVFDHWRPRSLRGYPHPDTTPVYVANRRMARTARRAGFADVELLGWGQRREPAPGLTVWSVPGEQLAGMRTNSYVITSGGVCVFVGTEARSLAAIDQVAADHRIDVAVLPINGARLLGRPLVMDAATALAAASRLGAHTLVPIHYSQRPIPPLLQTSTGVADLKAVKQRRPVRIAVLRPGTRETITSGHSAATGQPT